MKKTKKRPPTLKEMKSWYLDQAPHRSRIAPDRVFSAIYTPEGIRRMDGEYVRRICIKQEDHEALAKEIRKNPHLHREIKKNLLKNLRRCVKEGDWAKPFIPYDGPPWEKAYEKRRLKKLEEETS